MFARFQLAPAAYLVAVALWFTAMRYNPPSFYGVMGDLFGAVIVALLLAVILLKILRKSRGHEIAISIGSLAAFEALWRFYLSRTAWDAVKLISIMLDIGTPAVVLLGIAAVLNVRKLPLGSNGS